MGEEKKQPRVTGPDLQTLWFTQEALRELRDLQEMPELRASARDKVAAAIHAVEKARDSTKQIQDGTWSVKVGNDRVGSAWKDTVSHEEVFQTLPEHLPFKKGTVYKVKFVKVGPDTKAAFCKDEAFATANGSPTEMDQWTFGKPSEALNHKKH